MIDGNPNPDLMDLQISPLRRALSQLDIALTALSEKPEDTLIRDAVIQRFEFTYELSLRLLRRYLRATAFSFDEIDELTFKELIRRADTAKLLRNGWPKWGAYRQARTDSVHTYKEVRAIEVVSVARDFAEEARVLFDNLSRRLTDE